MKNAIVIYTISICAISNTLLTSSFHSRGTTAFDVSKDSSTDSVYSVASSWKHQATVTEQSSTNVVSHCYFLPSDFSWLIPLGIFRKYDFLASFIFFMRLLIFFLYNESCKGINFAMGWLRLVIINSLPCSTWLSKLERWVFALKLLTCFVTIFN